MAVQRADVGGGSVAMSTQDIRSEKDKIVSMLEEMIRNFQKMIQTSNHIKEIAQGQGDGSLYEELQGFTTAFAEATSTMGEFTNSFNTAMDTFLREAEENEARMKEATRTQGRTAWEAKAGNISKLKG